MAVTQSHYRFGINELAENTHGWHAAEDTNPNFGVIPVDTTFLLRFTIQSTGVQQLNTDPEFQYRKNGGTWTQITTGTTNVKAVTPSCWANAANTTQRLSGTGTFIGATGCTADGIAGGTAFDIVASGNGETECALQLVGADLTAGDLIEFRLTRDSAVLMDTYSVTPALGIPLAAASVITESSRIMERVFGAAIFVATAATLSTGMPWETARLSDSVQAQLDPPSNLSVQVEESVRTMDFVFGASRGVPTAMLSAGLMETVWHLSDSPVGSGIDALPSAENVKAQASGLVELIGLGNPIKITDGPVQATLVSGDDLARNITAESLKVVDVVLGPTLDPLQAAPAESLKVFDAAPPLAEVVLSANPTEHIKVSAGGFVELLEEVEPLKISDGPVIAALQAADGNLSANPSESLKVVDQLTVTITPLLPALLIESFKITDTGEVEISKDEVIKISDGPVLAALTPLFTGLLTESLIVSDVGFVEISKDETIKITDGPVQATLVEAGALARQVADESLKVVDQLTVTITPVFATLQESLKVVDELTVTSTTLIASLQESLKVVDQVTTTINPEETGLLTESLKVVDQLTTFINPEETGLLTESLKVVDQLTVTITPVFATLQEALKVVDQLTVTITPIAASLQESLKVVDLVLGPTIDPEQASTSESLKVVDVVLGPTLDPEQAAPAESLKVVDQLTAALGDMFLTVAQESLKVVDLVLGPTLNPLEATPTESLKVVDQTPPTASLGNNLFAFGFDDSLKVVDQVTTSINPEETTLSESLKVVDQLTVALQLAIAIANESLKVVDQVTTTLDPLQANLTDSLKVVDQDPVGSSPTTLVASPTESLKVVDQVTTSINPEETTLSDSLKVVDQLQAAMQLVVVITSESLKVVDQAPSALLDPLVAILTESLKVVDQTPSIADATDLTVNLQESLKVVDQTPTGRLNPLQVEVAADALKVIDQTPTGLLNPLLAGLLTESLKVVDQLQVGEGTTLVVNLTESLKVVDARSAVLDPEEVTRTESLKVTEALTLALTPEETTASESLKVVDQLTVSLDHLEVNLTESLKVVESGPRFGGPGIIECIGSYVTVIEMAGSYITTIDIVGESL